MLPRHLAPCLGLALLLGASVAIAAEVVPAPPAPSPVSSLTEHERNFWPWKVEQLEPSGRVRSWTAAGPFAYRLPAQEGLTASGVRPFYLAKRNPDGEVVERHYLYPFFTYRRSTGAQRWSVLNLVNRTAVESGFTTTGAAARGFDVWPFYFSRDTGDPETSYRAVFPFAGSVRHRFFSEKLRWVMFPLYVRTEERGEVTTGTPWPFIRRYSGEGVSGFSVWPLFDRRAREGVYRRNYYLWPFIYDTHARLNERIPSRAWGILPFYAYETTSEVISESYAWPFFGYTHRILPHRYDERRWFWPLVVTGDGDDRVRRRFAPFYTYSSFLGEEKTWVLWPLYRHRTWVDGNVRQHKTQLFYFVYWSRTQHSLTNPDAEPATRRHLWPLISTWNNGAGRRQFQIFSPLEVLVSDNENMRLNWSPLFSIYRYDETPEYIRKSAVFDLITWRRDQEGTEFHFGPLLDIKSAPDQGRVSLAGGLVGMRRETGRGWRPFLFDFSRRARDADSTAATTPAGP